VLTSGGDAPGMNALIAAVAEAADRAGIETVGIRRGYLGASLGEAQVLRLDYVRSHLRESGTWLQSSRFAGMTTEDGLADVVRQLEAARLVGLVVAGGDGSLGGARLLADTGLCVGFVPATIDNDVPGTETTLGHDSAVSYGVQVIEQLRLTGFALPGRAFLVQTLGGGAHGLAQAVARAGGVEDLLASGAEEEIARVSASLLARSANGEAIAVMPEAIGNAVELSAKLQERSGIHVHPTILGHAQRAAPVTEADLRLAAGAGEAALAAVLGGESAFVALDRSGTTHARAINDPITGRVPATKE
jgi:6-phosphofructokinase 1